MLRFSRRLFMCAAVLVAGGTPAHALLASADSTTRPNILFLHVDDQRTRTMTARMIAFHGREQWVECMTM